VQLVAGAMDECWLGKVCPPLDHEESTCEAQPANAQQGSAAKLGGPEGPLSKGELQPHKQVNSFIPCTFEVSEGE
jgi:hypothetical protein